MADTTSRIRIDLNKDALTLQTIRLGDSFGIIYDKVNSNFLEVQKNGGGPMGPVGPLGPPGCRGEAGAQGSPGESDLNWRSLKSKRCNSEAYNNENLTDTIVNRLTNRGLLLTNLTISDDGNFKAATPDEEQAITERISSLFSQWKNKIYSSLPGGEGGHLHLLNTAAVEVNSKYLCKSGFTISDDFDTTGINKEILRIKGRKNRTPDTDLIDPIKNHTVEIELTSDLFTLRQKDDGQSWEFDVNQDVTNANKLKYTLDAQTKENEVNIPDRSGYMPVWEDTLARGESWEVLTVAAGQVDIYKSMFLDSDLVPQNFVYGGNHYVTLHSDSFIRFKRMNNWVLVDFHIGLLRNSSYDGFTLRNIQFIVTIPTLGCRTVQWFPSSVMENENIDEDSSAISAYGHFKVEAVELLTGEDTFLIANKFPYNIYNITFDSTALAGAENYWISGQNWATVSGADYVCDLLEIEQCTVCPTVVIEQT